METPRVRDWMTSDPVMIQDGSSLGAVRALMQRTDVHRLLVVDEDQRLVGIVTLGDVVEAWPSRYSALEPFEIREQMARVEVDEIMTSPVITVDPDATIAEAVSLMFEHRIGALPVVEERRVRGILTNSDILQGLVRVLAQVAS
jgi:acetoin utilization protein AcuB